MTTRSTMEAADGTEPAEKAARSIRRRGEIMDAAAEIFAQKGYHATTTRDIADRLGMQAGSLYYYLESKEAALAEVCRVGAASFEAGLDAIMASRKPAAEMVRAGIAMHLQGEKRHYVTCFVYNRRLLPPLQLKEMNEGAKRYVRQWAEIFRLGVDQGAFAPALDCRQAAFAVLALCNGAVPNLERRGPAEIAAFVGDLGDLFLNGVLRRSG